MKTYKELKEGLSHDYILQSLADKDINAHVKSGKVVVHPDDASATRRHLQKIGHGHLKVTTKGVHQVAEEVESLDEISKELASKYRDKAEDKLKKLPGASNLGITGDQARQVHNTIKGINRAGDRMYDYKRKTIKGYKEEGASREHALKSLADKGISAHSKDGNIVVHPNDLKAARKHLQKIGHIHLKVKKGANQVAEEVESLDEIKLATVGKIIKHSPKIASAAIGAAVAAHSAEPPKQPVKASITQVAKNVQEEVELDESVIPVQKATDSVHKVLGPKGAIRFLSSLKPGKEKHTTWDKVNTALAKQGTQPHHIAKIAGHIKEEVELDEVLDPSMGAGEYVKDFQKSDAPQFKGKSQEKRRIMGIAAYMAAKREKNK